MSVYGIDLGTTNSLLGQGDRLLTGLVPSIVDLQAKKVGSDERENVDKQDCVVELSVLLPYLLSSMITSVRQL